MSEEALRGCYWAGVIVFGRVGRLFLDQHFDDQTLELHNQTAVRSRRERGKR